MKDLTPLRRRILEVAARAGEGHVPSALSILDLLWVLYRRHLAVPRYAGWDTARGLPAGYPREPLPPDRLILSKGHGALALYVVLEKWRLLPRAELDRFCQPGALMGHPERKPEWGIEATTGSLGHGLPMAVGLAYGLRLQGSDARVFCLVGDGEMEEGSCWESLHLAARLGLTNLTVIVDCNGTSPNRINGATIETSLAAKFVAFGWHATHCDGHDHDSIAQALKPAPWPMPRAVIAHTVKGKGVAAMEREPQAWHHRAPTAEMLA